MMKKPELARENNYGVFIITNKGNNTVSFVFLFTILKIQKACGIITLERD